MHTYIEVCKKDDGIYMSKLRYPITDIAEGGNLIIKSFYINPMRAGEADVNFDTICHQVFPKGIIVETVRSEEGQPIDFSSNIVQSDLYYIRENQSPIIWENVIIKSLLFDGEHKHIIVPRKPGRKFNRRAHFRVYIGLSGVAQLGLNKGTKDIIIHDMSYSGFSILADKETKIHVNDTIRVTFDDRFQHFAINGICVRRQLKSNDSVIYGCVFPKKSKEIREYVLEKQQKKVMN